MPAFSRLLADNRPSETALVNGERAFGWAEVDSILNRTAGLLLSADLGPSRRVAVFAENAAETAFAHLGGLLGGASTVPVSFHLTAPEASYILEESDSRILFVGPETAPRGVEAAQGTGVETIVGWGEGLPPGVVAWDQWLAAGPDTDPPGHVTPRPHLMFTSGTTGRPKGTDLPPTMFAGGATMVEHLEALKGSRYARYGTHLVVGPMYHTGPLSGLRTLIAGVPTVILGRFDAQATLAAIERHRVETSVMVPTHFVRMLGLPASVRDRYDVSSVKLVAHTGAKCPIDVKRAMIDWWGPVFVDAYGATEVGTTCSITSEDWLTHPGSVGRPVPPFEALVVDDDDRPVPPNNEGRLFFRDTTGRGVVYHNDPEKSRAAHLEPGVFTLGEMGYVDDDGFVYITDRFSDMVVSGGVNLYPAEAENVLIEHPGVADVACIGIPHDEMGEEMRALVVTADGWDPDGDAILEFCRERLSRIKCPRSVEFVDDLGRSAMGKLNKRALRAPYWR
ncbi:MAG: AMP-binding protein [Acidimicrobiaceae bacterium]|nr:AMP-binding protein [Acidimicrobiaceae bacterium]MYL04901.1 AMP-binding protein [Acidimicrobiaceae bacterium]